MPECPACNSGHVNVEPHSFFHNGVLGKSAEVAWCRTCDLVWVMPAAEIQPKPASAAAAA
jgi:hypothetical protein